MIVCGIVTFNPDIERFRQNLSVVTASDDISKIIVVDNGSGNVEEIASLLDHRSILLRNAQNEGIARALNQIFLQAGEWASDWVLTLDQDSILSVNAVEVYKRQIERNRRAGVVSCRVVNERFGNMYTKSESGCDEVAHCITSGSMVRMEAWRNAGTFFEPLFIDGVDFDFCIRIRKAGYSILRCNEVALQQRIGRSYKVKLFGRDALVLNHNTVRYYYIARNYLFIGHKYGQSLHWTAEVLKRALLVLLFENKKGEKLRAMCRGVRHAVEGKLYSSDSPHRPS